MIVRRTNSYIFLFLTIILLIPSVTYSKTINAVEWGILGDSLVAQKKYSEAIKAYSKGLPLAKDFLTIGHNLLVTLYIRIGNAYASLNEIDLAIENFTEAITLDPKNEEAHFNRGVATLNKKNLDWMHFAVEDFTEVIAVDSTYALAYYYRGLAESYHSKAKARADFKIAVRLGESDAQQALDKLTKKSPLVAFFGGIIMLVSAIIICLVIGIIIIDFFGLKGYIESVKEHYYFLKNKYQDLSNSKSDHIQTKEDLSFWEYPFEQTENE